MDETQTTEVTAVPEVSPEETPMVSVESIPTEDASLKSEDIPPEVDDMVNERTEETPAIESSENTNPEDALLKPEDIPEGVAELAEDPKCPKCRALMVEENLKFKKNKTKKFREKGKNYYPVFAYCKICDQDMGVAGGVRTKGPMYHKSWELITPLALGTKELRREKRRKANRVKRLNRKTNRGE